MRRKKTFIPNDTRDFLSTISFIGLSATALRFLANITWLDNHLTDFFLIFIGLAFVVVGQLFTLKRWASDGIQDGEVNKIVLNVVGLTAIILGILLLSNVAISVVFNGIIGIIGVIAAIFVLVDYIQKNKN